MKMIIGFFCLFFFVSGSAFADLGPKPTISILFMDQKDYKPNEKKLEAYLLICESASCLKSKRLEQMGPQHFSCSWDTAVMSIRCDGMAYGFTQFLKLELDFGGKIIQSNIFEYTKIELKARLNSGKLRVMPK